MFARLIFNTSGNRTLISTLCVKCGTLFVDDFHPLSFLIVAVKLAYPFILSLLLCYIFDCQAFEGNYTILTFISQSKTQSQGKEKAENAQEKIISQMLLLKDKSELNYLRAERLNRFLRLAFVEQLSILVIILMVLFRFLLDSEHFNDAILMGEFLPYWLSFVIGTGVFRLVMTGLVI